MLLGLDFSLQTGVAASFFFLLLSELLSTYQHLVCPSEQVNEELPSDFFFYF